VAELSCDRMTASCLARPIPSAITAVGFGASRLVPADAAERPLSGQSGDFGTRGKGKTGHSNGAAELRHQLAAISAERNEPRPLRVCRGGGQS